MKKKSFLSGIGAKLALAAVALTTVVFTSCEKEEFNVEPVELPNASATVVVTVYFCVVILGLKNVNLNNLSL